MTIDPADLPPDVRRGLLDQLRSQIGDSNYRELMDRADEDQVLKAMLTSSAESRPSAPSKSSPPAWAVIVGKVLLIALLGGMAWLIGTVHPAGRAFAGAAMGVFWTFAFDAPGFGFGAVIGGALGGGLGKKLDGAMGGAIIGGWAVVLIRVALEWLAKQAASITRYR